MAGGVYLFTYFFILFYTFELRFLLGELFFETTYFMYVIGFDMRIVTIICFHL